MNNVPNNSLDLTLFNFCCYTNLGVKIISYCNESVANTCKSSDVNLKLIKEGIIN